MNKRQEFESDLAYFCCKIVDFYCGKSVEKKELDIIEKDFIDKWSPKETDSYGSDKMLC